MIWLMLRGDLPSEGQAGLLDTALMSAVDHGPQAPSIAIARMAMSCGVGLNNAMASAVNVLGDVHGGAGEQAVELYGHIVVQVENGAPVEEAAASTIDGWQTNAAGSCQVSDTASIPLIPVPRLCCRRSTKRWRPGS